MIRVLIFIFIFFNFINADDIFKPLFPKGEKIQNFILNTPLKPINNLMSHSGNFLITFEGSYQTKLRIWDIKKKKIIFQLNNINSDSKQLALSKDDRYLIYDDNSYIVLFDIKQRKIKKKIKIDNIISSFDISNDGKYIVISTSNKLMLYEIKTNQFLYKKIFSSLKQVIISKKNDYFTILNDKYIKLIELKSGKELFSFSLENIKKIDISKDEKFIVAISDDTIYNLNLLDKTIDKIDTKGSFEDVKIFDNKLIITAGKSHLYGLNIWNLETKEKIYTMSNMGELKNISLSFDNKYLSTIEEYTTALYIINIFTSKLFNLNGLKNTKEGIYSKETEEIFSIGNDKKGIKVWDLKENILKNSLDDNLTILDICLSQNEKLLVYACIDDKNKREIKVYNIKDKKVIYSFEEKDIWNIANLVINKHQIAYSGGYSNYKIKFLDIDKSKIIQELSSDDYIYDLKLSNKYIVISSSANLIVIDIRSKKIVNQIVKNNNSYLSLYSNPNFYSIRNYSKGTFEVRELLANKKVFSTEKYIDDIVGNLVFIDDYKQGQVWDLKEKKYINKLKENFYSIYTGEKIILTRLNDNKIINKIFYKKNNRWLIEDTINKKVYRYMDKNFYLNSKTFDSIFSTNNKKIKKTDIDIFVTKNELKLINYQIDNFDIQIENLTDKPIYDINFRVDDENFSIVYTEPLIIEPHSIKKIPINVHFNNQLKNSSSKDINLEILINGLFQKIPLKVNIIKKDIKELEIESLNTLRFHYTKDNLEIKIKNLTNYDLKNIKATIYYHNKIVGENQLNIDANSSYAMTFRMDKNISKDGFFNTFLYKFNDNEFNVTLQKSLFKSYKSIEIIENSFEDYANIFILFVYFPFMALLTLSYWTYHIFYLKKYNRSIKRIKNNPSLILDIPLSKLPYYKTILKRQNKDNYRIYFSYVLENDLERVSKFYEVSNQEKAKIISERVNGKLKQLDDNLFEIKLDENFAIKVDKILLYFSEDVVIKKIYKELEKEQNKPILIIAKNEKEQEILSENSKLNELKNVIATLPRNLKMFLLQENHSLTLSKILSTKLDRKLISPYNFKGGVQNESYFFGREKIINNIVNRELSNYLIVGARQIGKTSLLIALERIFKQRDELVTIFITISGDNIIKKIALKLKLSPKTTLEELEEYILTSNKKYLFLIDEVDGFIKNEEERNYKILNTFRSLTQERQAYFIMAGFWELYAQATYDYQSPIKNFGEIITIDKLEVEACIDLVFKPMKALNLRYENIEKDAVYMIQSLGQRANLIATVANQIVENLEPYRYEITREDIDRALDSRSVIDSFYSWKKLTSNKFKSSIDKFIVYYTIGLDSFTIRKIINFFKKLDVDKVTIEEIQESLDRLELSYILVKEGRTYFYTIPLFQENLQKDDISVILDEMIDEFCREYRE